MKLTALKVELLMHISSVDSPIENACFPAQRDALIEFEMLGIIAVDPEIRSCRYKLTELGNAYANLILATPIPVIDIRFIDPRTGEPL